MIGPIPIFSRLGKEHKFADKKVDALIKLVDKLVTDKYTMPGSNYISNTEISDLLKELRGD